MIGESDVDRDDVELDAFEDDVEAIERRELAAAPRTVEAIELDRAVADELAADLEREREWERLDREYWERLEER
jgi:hypothetical protein